MPSAEPISGFGVFRVDMLSLGGTVKERVMAARRGVFRSGVHGVVGYESDMVERKHAAEWDVLMVAVAHATVVLCGWSGVCGRIHSAVALPDRMASGEIQAEGM
jgi:hypothetical protein